MKYEYNILERLIKTYGVVGNPKYVSEIIKQFIIQGKECYPNLFTYQSDWLAHIDEFGLANDYVVTYTGQRFYAPNTKESPVKRAILKGNTGCRDIDTGEFLETFEEGRNLELVSVKIPVLTTSNEDGTKTNILTTPFDLTLRGIGDVKDTLDCLTGEVVERVGEVVLDGSESWTKYQNTFYTRLDTLPRDSDYTYIIMCSDLPVVPTTSHLVNANKGVTGYTKNSSYVGENWVYVKFEDVNDVDALKMKLSENPITVQYHLANESIKTVDLNIKDQNNQVVNHLTSFEGGTHFDTSSRIGSVLPTLEVDVVVDLEETLKTCSLEGNTM